MPPKKNFIHIKGAKLHNLKGIELKLPHGQFIVFTGVSGSGKSSLAFDTLYAEGQQRYVESLSSYARQFLNRLAKPEVDFIKGLPPAIAIEQKTNTQNARSTVGTATEIYDYLRILFTRVGKTISPISGTEVKQHSVADVVEYIENLSEGLKLLIVSPISVPKNRLPLKHLEILMQQGFSRILYKGEIFSIDDLLQDEKFKACSFGLVIDRLSTPTTEYGRVAESIEVAFFEGHGICHLLVYPKEEAKPKKVVFSNLFEADGMLFEPPTFHSFNFNNPIGACPMCEGFGKVHGIDPNLVIPDPTLSVYQKAVACWRGEKMDKWRKQVIKNSNEFPIHRPYTDLTEEERQSLWEGTNSFQGINDFFKYCEQKSYKIQYRIFLARYKGKTACPECSGSRLKKGALYVKIGGKNICQLTTMPIDELLAFFQSLKLNPHDSHIAKRGLTDITNRLQYLVDVGLPYLTLDRLSSTLSGGESQRISLATQLGSSLVGSLYVLDEPSVGLHPEDTKRLIKVLKKLQQLGNTLVVVEHEEDIIRAADLLVDLGPGAGWEGGKIVWQGKPESQEKNAPSLTLSYLNGQEHILTPKKRKASQYSITLEKVSHNNLKGFSVSFPLEVMTVVTGVSGSGKSSLIKDIFYPAVARKLNFSGGNPGKHREVTGDYDRLSFIEFVDQSPIGKSSRSNPATYLKAWDEIRTLLALQSHDRFKPSHFSFNSGTGRCPICQGEGEITVEMQFMADITLPCEECQGKRFKEEILEITYREKNAWDILNMTVSEAITFFKNGGSVVEKRIIKRLLPLQETGLDYVKLGQSSSTLSGGEAQRIKLASILSHEKTKPTLFIFDEPSVGLHFHDVKKLLAAFSLLLERGHTLLVVEHNLDIIKCADHLIDLGPKGGDKGGELLYAGAPEGIIQIEQSLTAKHLKGKLDFK